MSTTAIKLYDILVESGVDKAIARDAVDEIVTREEAAKMLSTKEDIANLRVELKATENRLIMWVLGIQLASLSLIVAFG